MITEPRATGVIMFKCRKCNITFPSARAKAVHKKSTMHKRAAKNEMELDKSKNEVQLGMSSLSM